MRFVGQAEVAAFLANSSRHQNTVRAWVAEMKSGRWSSADALTADFRNVDVSKPPWVTFYLAPSALRIQTLIDFRIGVVMMSAIDIPARPGDQTQPWNRTQ